MSKPEIEERERQLGDLLKNEFIQTSESPYGAPVFSIRKKDGSLRLMCDWRHLNKITIKNKVCLPQVEDLFDVVQGSTFFSNWILRQDIIKSEFEKRTFIKQQSILHWDTLSTKSWVSG